MALRYIGGWSFSKISKYLDAEVTLLKKFINKHVSETSLNNSEENVDDNNQYDILNQFKESYLIPNGILSSIDLPIMIQGEFAGVLCVEQKSNKRTWSQPEISFCKSIADFVYMSYESFVRKEAEELVIQKKYEIEMININLEKTIQERTKDVNLRNQKLEEYAFLNSHILRGPMCRITGVIYLIEND